MQPSNPATGFNYLLRGFSLIKRKELRPYVVIPLLINIIIFSVMLWLGIDLYESLMNQYLPDEGLPMWLPDWTWLEILLTPLRWIAWILFALAFMLIFFYGFTLVANLIAAPFNDRLSAKVEELLTGERPQESESGSLLSIASSSIMQEINKLGWFATRAIPLLLLFFIPVVNLVAPLLWGLFCAYSLAYEYLDYPMCNHGIEFRQQRRFHRKQRLATIGFGGGVMLIMAIPFISFAAMPVAVCGASAWWAERLKSRYPE